MAHRHNRLGPVAFFISFIAMMVQSTNSLRVAVLGSGIAGSSAARTLAERGVQVTVFEAGFGIGGRTSTRITREEPYYQFDHGAQYIGSPKTEIFRESLESWKKEGFVKEWLGTFATASTDNHNCASLDIEPKDEAKERWIGFPRMNSICTNLLDHENIQVELQTRANAIPNDEHGWNIEHSKTKHTLGTFDWLIASDRNSGAKHRSDLSLANLQEFTDGISKIQSIKSLTAMVVFEEPLNLKLDGIQFTGKDPRFGSLGWAARDTSKPGRERSDNHECWVLQSHPESAKALLQGKYKIGEIREMAREILIDDFCKSLPYLVENDSNQEKVFKAPAILHSVGHRWGAAFPILSQDYQEMECQVIASEHFVACGDYFGTLSGRIEGAFLSGRSAANEILQCHKIQTELA